MLFAKRTASEETVRRIPLRLPPRVGKRWSGTPHKDTVDQVQQWLSDQGFHSTHATYKLYHDGDCLAACWDLRPSTLHHAKDYQIHPNVYPTLGLTTGNDRRSGLHLYLGATVAFPDHPKLGMVTSFGDGPVGHLKPGLDLAFPNLRQSVDNVQDDITALKNWPLHKPQVEALCVAIGDSEAMPWSRSGLVYQDYQSDGKPAGWLEGSAWTFACAFGHHNRRNAPYSQLRRLAKLRQLLHEYGN